MSVAQEIQRIAQAKADIRNAILSKGVKIADTDRIDTYADKVKEISGGSEGSGKYRVRFFDYDGTILKTVYTDGGEVTAPTVPEHERLLFQEWNNDFDNVTSDLDVGAIYTTKSGKCEIDIDVNSLTGLTQYVGIKLASGTVTIEWGDGQSETLSTVGDTRVAHTYASGGRYTILVSGTADWKFLSRAFTPAGSGNNVTVMAIRLCSAKYSGEHVLGALYMCQTISIDKQSTAAAFNLFNNSRGVCHLNFPRGFGFNSYWIATSCSRLASVTIPAGIANIGNAAFNGTTLSDIVLPEALKAIPAEFCLETSIRAITIPSQVTVIGTRAFIGANLVSPLRKVIMKPTTPPTITLSISDTYSNSFQTNGSLKEIIVPAGCGEAYKSATNWSYYADIIREEEI